MATIRLIDTTLRDGSHAVSHSYSPQTAAAVASGLDQAGVFLIEISHGDGIAGSSLNYGLSQHDELDLLGAARRVIRQAKLGVLLLPGIGTIEDLARARDLGVDAVRVATHVTEADIALQHLCWAKEQGMFTTGFLMMAHMAEPAVIAEQAKIFADAGVDYINLADSAGYLTPVGVTQRITALKEAVDIPIGFHAHNNLGLAIANSLAAAEAGAEYLDGTCQGLGAGAGNAQLEVLAAVLDRQGYTTGADIYALMDVAAEQVEPLMQRPQVVTGDALMLGYAGVYSSFLLHARRAAQKYGLDTREILAELGKRKMVGGQEDMIVDVAYDLAKGNKRQTLLAE